MTVAQIRAARISLLALPVPRDTLFGRLALDRSSYKIAVRAIKGIMQIVQQTILMASDIQETGSCAYRQEIEEIPSMKAKTANTALEIKQPLILLGVTSVNAWLSFLTSPI